MSNLFYLPRVHSQAGAKLYMRQTGTSTPQATYQDVDLTVAHANPVVADADGYFDPIYLDPSLPNYRVIHTDGSDAGNDPTLEVELEPTLDDVPSSSNISSAYRVKGTAPTIIFEETDQTSANKKWRLQVNGNSLTLAPLNDAEDTVTGGLSISRFGILSYSGDELATLSDGDFTGSISGMAATLEGLFSYERDGSLVSLYLHTLVGPLVGTSNATTMTLTGMPVALRPKATVLATCHGLVDNGTYALPGVASVSTAGVVTFKLMGNPPTAFTGSGDKGIDEGWLLVYQL